MMLLQCTAFMTLGWLFLIALYIRPSYRRVRAREGR